MSLLHRLTALRESGGRGVLFTVVEGDGVGSKALVVEGGETTGDGVPSEALDLFGEVVRGGRNRLLEVDGAKVFAEWYGPPPRLVDLRRRGHGRIALPRGEAARLDGDRRGREGDVPHAERIPSADQLVPKWPDEALAEVAPTTRRLSSS